MIGFAHELTGLTRAVAHEDAARREAQARQDEIARLRTATAHKQRAAIAANVKAPIETAILRAMRDLQAGGEKATRRAVSDRSGLTLNVTHHHMTRMEDAGLLVRAGMSHKTLVFQIATPEKKAA